MMKRRLVADASRLGAHLRGTVRVSARRDHAASSRNAMRADGAPDPCVYPQSLCGATQALRPRQSAVGTLSVLSVDGLGK